MELERLYRHRFAESDLPGKLAVWKVLCEDFFSRYVGPNDTVVDIGSGYCEFINNIRCGRRIAIDVQSRIHEFAAPDVEVRNDSCNHMVSIPDGAIDVVFMSNFLEHLPSKQLVLDTLVDARRILRMGGRISSCSLTSALWEVRIGISSTTTPLTEHSLVEAITSIDMHPSVVISRFLPYTTKSLLPQAPWLVRLYLKVPMAWVILGKQSLVVAEKTRRQ